METDHGRYVIGEKEAAQISTYCNIARANKSALRLSELIQLLAIDATEEDLKTAWYENDILRSRYLLSSGYIVERSWSGSDSVRKEDSNRERADLNLSLAREFAGLCIDGRVKLFAVSGGNSYKSARSTDDIDFFCVTTRGSLWIFLLKSFILARLYSMARKSPQLCFSYVIDERRVQRDFGEARDGLFARDALSAQVISGGEYYRSLLEEAGWIKGYFPKMYRYRTNAGSAGTEKEVRARPSGGGGSRVLNSFLYYTLGSYVRVKAFLANGRYRRRGQVLAVFKVRMDVDHCIYESNKYRWLRRMYKGPATLRAEGISE